MRLKRRVQTSHHVVFRKQPTTEHLKNQVIVDFQMTRVDAPLTSMYVAMYMTVTSFNFLGFHIMKELSWSVSTETVMAKA